MPPALQAGSLPAEPRGKPPRRVGKVKEKSENQLQGQGTGVWGDRERLV